MFAGLRCSPAIIAGRVSSALAWFSAVEEYANRTVTETNGTNSGLSVILDIYFFDLKSLSCRDFRCLDSVMKARSNLQMSKFVKLKCK